MYEIKYDIVEREMYMSWMDACGMEECNEVWTGMQPWTRKEDIEVTRRAEDRKLQAATSVTLGGCCHGQKHRASEMLGSGDREGTDMRGCEDWE